MTYHSSFAILVGCLLAACAHSSAPPATTAMQFEKLQCNTGTIPQYDAQVLKETTIIKVDPLYSHVHSSYNDYEARVNGATLLVHAPRDVSPSQMTKALQCHSARAALGQVESAQLQNDPYYLPEASLDIMVEPRDDNYAVTVRAHNVHDGLEVLAHANAQSAHQNSTAGSNTP